MKILITGASGFIGYRLYSFLHNNGYDVVTLNRSIDNRIHCPQINKDIMDISSCNIQDIDIIFHCASTIDNTNIYNNPTIDFQTNCIGTIKLLDACKSHPNIKIIYLSSFFAVGNDKDTPKPLGLYGASKLATENICSIYNNVFNMNIIICRLSNVYGIGESVNNNKAVLNKMILNSVSGLPITLHNNGLDVRDYIYIDDCISALYTIMQHGVNNTVYEIGSGIGMSMCDIVTIIKQYLSQTNVLYSDIKNVMNISKYCSDILELKKLGWNKKTDIYTGIKKTIEWYSEVMDDK